MTSKKYMLFKAATNVISGISMVTLISLGVMYLSFKNEFVFSNIKIEVVNNPVTHKEVIEFIMIGSKKHECNSTAVYGIAYEEFTNIPHKLDMFTKQYTHNTQHGTEVPNQWTLAMPESMKPGVYRVSMTGEFVCNYLIFQTEKSQTYDNILLTVEPRNK